MEHDSLRDFLKYLRINLPWLIVVGGFLLVILVFGFVFSAQFFSPELSESNHAQLDQTSIDESATEDSLEVVFNPISLDDTEATAGAGLTLPKLSEPTPTPAIPHESDEILELSEELQKQQSTQESYTVQSGDTLWKIAQEKYGNGGAYSRISQENNLSNPNLLAIGQVLIIPQDNQKGTISPKAAKIDCQQMATGEVTNNQDQDTGYCYTIVRGDTLWDIAAVELDNPYDWSELYYLNKEVLGTNPDLIFPNTVIYIPPAG